MEIERILTESSWRKALINEWDKPYFKQLNEFLEDAYSSKEIVPKKENVFEAFNQCSFDNVKVVILGQDPYPTAGHAHGLCFSVDASLQKFPKSLNNIFKEINSDLDIPVPPNGNLTRWAQQGVLLLNTVLTVEAGKTDSHVGKGWEIFTDSVISLLNEQKENLVFILWGNKAQQKRKMISSKQCVLASPHPSPLSAHRGFFGCKHFSQTNFYLEQHQLAPINW
jgi:uracil-DNA glycosylase